MSALSPLGDLRAVLVTGKGGVGKTTVAASIARRLAALGRRVLVAEIASEEAAASPLADALGLERLTDEAAPVAPNLRASLITPTLGHQRFLRDVLPFKILADGAMRSAAIRRFLTAAPTFPEMGVLHRLFDLVGLTRGDGAFEHETIVVDLPATGHALALAQVPQAVLRVMSAGPVAKALEAGLALLNDPARTGAVIVTLPETLPVTEAIELANGMGEHGIPLSQVVVNRVPFDPFASGEREAARRLLAGRPPMLGSRTLERIDRSDAAVARLTGALSAPVSTLYDIWIDGPRLTEEMASLMAVDAAS